MRATLSHPAFSITDKIKKAAQTGRPPKFTIPEVQILLRDEIYSAIARLEAEEMRKACEFDADNDNSSAFTGSGNEQTPALGASAGLSVGATEVMALGARQRLSVAMSEVKLHKKPSLR